MTELIGELKRMQQEMERLFQEAVFTNLPPRGNAFRQPDADLRETEKELIATFDLPGVEKSSISLKVNKDSIIVKAERNVEKEVKREGYLHQERSWNSYYRSFHLPAAIIPNQVNAEYKNGVLTVRMPKQIITQIRTKQISIKVK